MNKGRAYKIPGIGLAGDWPGGWTQTYAQVDTEAGPHGFDKDYFVQQVAGLSQLTGELMLVKPRGHRPRMGHAQVGAGEPEGRRLRRAARGRARTARRS